MVFVVRNVGISTAIAVTVLGRVEFAVFATAYFLAQVPVLLAAVLAFRRLRVADQTNPQVLTTHEPLHCATRESDQRVG
jgi:hypothetical protein